MRNDWRWRAEADRFLCRGAIHVSLIVTLWIRLDNRNPSPIGILNGTDAHMYNLRLWETLLKGANGALDLLSEGGHVTGGT